MLVLDLHDGPVQDIFAALSQLTSLRARMSVKFHLRNLYSKLGVANRTQAAAHYHRRS